jgi:chromosome segregation ATPase
LKTVPDAPESRYLYTVLAGHDFQEGLKNYRDMAYMDRTLQRWGDSMEAFHNMVETRERAYALRLPKTDALLATNTLESMAQRRASASALLGSIEHDQDVAALGSAEERDQWNRIQQLEASLNTAPKDEETNALRERLRLVKGVLYFRLNDSFRARLWQQKRSIKDLDLALAEAQNRWIRVEKARKSTPTNTGDFDARIASLQQRIVVLQRKLVAAEVRQNEHLQKLAVAQLRTQQDRLATYQVQARFALASIYDRAANADQIPPEKGPPAPSQNAPGKDSGLPSPSPADRPVDTRPPESGMPAERPK